MIIRESELRELDRIRRLNIVNSLSGIKPANLIGTASADGRPNLAIFSSIVHLGSDPALFGFVARPSETVRRDTVINIRETGYYTINHIALDFVARAHATSAKIPRAESEFERCKLSEEYIEDIPAPFVAESSIKLGMRFVQEIEIPVNQTSLFIGRLILIDMPDDVVEESGYLNLESAKGVGISGLNSYYSLKREKSYPYVREGGVEEIVSEEIL